MGSMWWICRGREGSEMQKYWVYKGNRVYMAILATIYTLYTIYPFSTPNIYPFPISSTGRLRFHRLWDQSQ